MERQLSILEPSNHIQTKTDTLRFKVKPRGESTIAYSFSEQVRNGIEIEWVASNGTKGKFTPDGNGKFTQTVNTDTWIYIYYTYQKLGSYSAYLSKYDYFKKNYDIKIIAGTKKFHIITSLDVSGCTALTHLDCGGKGYLEKLDVSGCTALMYLDCGGNQLWALDVSGCPALTSLYCHCNQLTSLDVSKNTALKYLYCAWNQLTSLNVSGCTTLTELSCDGNRLMALDVSQNTALTELSCYKNQLTSLDVSQNTALTKLSCSDNQLRSLDVSQNTALTELSCDGNHILLSDLYKAYIQNSDWKAFFASGQTDTIILPINQVLDLSSERLLGETLSTFEIITPDDDYTENGFNFQFHKTRSYTLTIENPSIINHKPKVEDVCDVDGTVPAFTYYISVNSEKSAR